MTDCIGYTRVSSEKQANEDRSSLSDQRKAIEALGRKLGRSVGAWFPDEGFSGGTAEGRPAFMALVRYCESHRRPANDGLVLVLNSSRFGRFADPDEAGHWRHELKRAGWLVRYCENDDSENVSTRHVMRAIGDAAASEFRATLRANLRRGKRGTAEQGFWGTREPYGYRRRVVLGGKDRVLDPGERKSAVERVRLTPYEPEARIVRRLFASYATGTVSIRSLSTSLPGKWSRTSIAAVLSNPAYVGDVVTARGSGGVVLHANAHSALVDRSVFATVQSLLKRNRSITRRVASSYVLSGLVRCAHCSLPYKGGGWHGSYRRDQNRPYYVDSAPRSLCAGKMGMVAKEMLEATLLGVVTRELERPQVQREIAAAVDRALDARRVTGKDDAATAKRRLGAIESERSRLVAAIARQTVLEAEAAPTLQALRDEASQLTVLLAKPVAVPSTKERDRLIAIARDFPAVARKLSGPALREVLAPWLAGATYDKHTRKLTVRINVVPSALQLHNSIKRAGLKTPRPITRTVVVPKVPRPRRAA